MCFNPSVGILFVHTRDQLTKHDRLRWFQSLGRDSVCSYQRDLLVCDVSSSGFNPSVGILFVHTTSQQTHEDKESAVSIPRSGFCLFILAGVNEDGFRRAVSIPRSGFCLFILVIQPAQRGVEVLFQSLGRDSVCSYRQDGGGAPDLPGVSIPRSGFCLFIPTCSASTMSALSSFNPSVGILFVHTASAASDAMESAEFQSLGRDSVCSYSALRWTSGRG